MNIPLIVAIILLVLISLGNSEFKEEYAQNALSSKYLEVPTYEPFWLRGSWAYYDPYRYKYGYYPLFPFYGPSYPYNYRIRRRRRPARRLSRFWKPWGYRL